MVCRPTMTTQLQIENKDGEPISPTSIGGITSWRQIPPESKIKYQITTYPEWDDSKPCPVKNGVCIGEWQTPSGKVAVILTLKIALVWLCPLEKMGKNKRNYIRFSLFIIQTSSFTNKKVQRVLRSKTKLMLTA